MKNLRVEFQNRFPAVGHCCATAARVRALFHAAMASRRALVGRSLSLRAPLSAIAAVSFVGALLPAPANADVIRFRLRGTIEVRDPFNVLPDGLETGMPFIGTFAYDADAIDQSPGDPNRASYWHAPPAPGLGFTIFIGDREFKTDPNAGFSFSVFNDVHLGVSETGEPQPPIGDSIHGTNDAVFPFACSVPHIGFAWIDESGMAFDDARPPQELNLGELHSVLSTVPVLMIGGFFPGPVESGPRSFSINAAITSIQPVPEPTSFALACTLASTIALFARRRKKRIESPPQKRSRSYETHQSNSFRPAVVADVCV